MVVEFRVGRGGGWPNVSKLQVVNEYRSMKEGGVTCGLRVVDDTQKIRIILIFVLFPLEGKGKRGQKSDCVLICLYTL